jgi:hypothetical protein
MVHYTNLQRIGKIPVVLHPQGHWDKHRYRPDCPISAAKMGAMIFNYTFAWVSQHCNSNMNTIAS